MVECFEWFSIAFTSSIFTHFMEIIVKQLQMCTLQRGDSFSLLVDSLSNPMTVESY